MQGRGISGVAASVEDDAVAALLVLPPARLGSLLSARRKEVHFRKKAAAEVAAIEVSVLDEIESGQRLPDANVLAALLKRYGVAPSEFLPRRKPLALTHSGQTSDEVLREFVDQIRKWRQAGGKKKLNFRQQDVVVLSELLGSDPDEIERRLIALTGCSRAEARQLRKWLLAALITIPVVAPLVGGVAAIAQAAPRHSGKATHQVVKSKAATAKAKHNVRAAHTLVWHDEFNGRAGAPPDPAKWQAVTGGGGWGNHELEDYTSRAANVSLDGKGHLAITAQHGGYRDSSGVTSNYTSGRIQTKGLYQSRYGQIEARIKLPAGQGLLPAFWALGGDGTWPAAGEIDLMENLGSDPFTIIGSIHGPQAGSPRGYAISAEDHSRVSLAAAFHVYGVEWSPKKIVFTLDGVPYATRTPSDLSSHESWVFNKPFYLLLNLAVGGTWPGSPNASSRFPVTMLVDWVRVYS
jgi:beta-glucanase (GH16 family)/transcriptional regulator with XRE-family HTH domain